MRKRNRKQTYKNMTGEMLSAYLSQLTPMEQKVLHIAASHLETSFSLVKSIGFKEWQEQQAPKAQEPKAQAQEPKAQAQEPKAQAQEQQAQAQEPKAQAQAPKEEAPKEEAKAPKKIRISKKLLAL